MALIVAKVSNEETSVGFLRSFFLARRAVHLGATMVTTPSNPAGLILGASL
jgi:hypothetical protein